MHAIECVCSEGRETVYRVKSVFLFDVCTIAIPCLETVIIISSLIFYKTGYLVIGDLID